MKIRDRKYKVENLYIVRVCQITKVSSGLTLFSPTTYDSKYFVKYYIAHRDKKDRSILENRYYYTIPGIYQSKVPDDVNLSTKEGDYIIREKHHFLRFFNEKRNKLSYDEILELEKKFDKILEKYYESQRQQSHNSFDNEM